MGAGYDWPRCATIAMAMASSRVGFITSFRGD
jgi:hypothetical protein